MLAARLAYARKGIRTSPANTAKKKPHMIGWKDKATTNPQQITAESNRWPDAGILTPTGSAHRLVVIDEDVPGELARLEEALGVRLRGISTEVKTPSEGRHVHLVLPEGVEVPGSVGKNLEGDGFPGIDVRGEGNLALLPPSPGYSFNNRLPRTEAPPEFMEWAISRKKAARPPTTAGQGGSVATFVAGEDPIPNGTRHDALASILGHAHDGTRSLADLTDLAHQVNASRCVPPIGSPGDDSLDDVDRIAASIHAKPPCRRRKKRDPDPDVEEALAACSDHWYAERLPGGGRSKVRDVYRAALKSAANRSEMAEAVVDGEVVKGPAFSDSCRQLAEVANTSHMSVSRNLNRLEEMGALTRIEAPEGLAHTYILTPAKTTPRTSVTPQGQPPASPIGERLVRGVTLVRADGLNVPFFGWRSPTGNSRAGAWAAMEAFGPLTEEQLAHRLGISRPRDARRRILEPLEALGAAVRDGETWSVPEDHELVADSLWHEPYATVTRRRERTRTSEGRVVTAVEEHVTVASDGERVEAMKERHRKDRELFAQRLREAAERSEEELRQDDEIRELLNAWDDEREGLAVDEADGFVGELELVEEGRKDLGVAPESVEVPGGAGDALAGHERPQMAHTDGAPAAHTNLPSGGVLYYQETTGTPPESGDLSDLAEILGRFLERSPHRVEETPSWLANWVWSETNLGSVSKARVVSALAELGRSCTKEAA